MKTVNIHQAKTTFSALRTGVDRGDDVFIARDGTPVTKPVPVAPPQARQPGLLRGVPEWRGFTCDPALFAPMTDAELAEEGWE